MLPIAKYPSYLSPSSLRVYETQPFTFYCQRMAPEPIPYDPQGVAAAVGTAFDMDIKMYWLNHLWEKLGSKEADAVTHHVKEVMLKGMHDQQKAKDLQGKSLYAIFNEGIADEWKDEAIPMGKVLLQKYLLAFKGIEITSVEYHRNMILTANPWFPVSTPVPLFMKLDAACRDMYDIEVVAPFDWKVMGYGSTTGASPKPGYMAIYEDGFNKGPHKKYAKDIPAELVDPSWATQLCTYGWGLGHKLGVPFPAYIDAIIIRPNGIRIARYRMLITADYQRQVFERYHNAWVDIKSGSFVARLGTRERKLAELCASNETWY